jgi:hypothetical protein
MKTLLGALALPLFLLVAMGNMFKNKVCCLVTRGPAACKNRPASLGC